MSGRVLLVDQGIPDVSGFLAGIDTNVCVLVGNPIEIANMNTILDGSNWEDIRRYKCPFHSSGGTVSGWREYIDGSGSLTIEGVDMMYPECICSTFERPQSIDVIHNIGFVWDASDPYTVPFGDGERVNGVYNSGFLELIGGLSGNVVVDLITCDRYVPHFKNETRRVEEMLGVTIRYSLDKTGNPQNGGDWIMESTGESIRDLWFDDMILEYHHLLGALNTSLANVYMTIGERSFVAGMNSWWKSNAGIGANSGDLGEFQYLDMLPSKVEKFSGHTLTFAKLENGDIYATGVFSSIIGNPVGTGFGVSGFEDTSAFTKLEPTTIDAVDIVDIRTLYDATLALSVSGDLYFSGGFNLFQQGRGFNEADSTVTYVDFTPTPLFNQVIQERRAMGINVVSFDMGEKETFVVFDDGSVIGSGSNLNGELGLGNTDSYNYEVIELPIHNVSSVYVQRSTYFLLQDGTVGACGKNERGQLGLGHKNTPVLSPERVLVSNVKSIAYGSHDGVYFLKYNGDVFACGKNQEVNSQFIMSRLGDGTTDEVDIPVKVAENVASICTLEDGVLFIKRNGAIQSFGSFSDSNRQERILPYQPFTQYSDTIQGTIRYWLREYGENMSNVKIFGNNSGLEYTLASDVRRYPPVGMTGNTTTITGQEYGNGTYVASSSSVFSSGQGVQPFIGFDYKESSGSGWHSADSTYNINTGVYIQSFGSNINGYFGDWLKIEMPESVVIREYTIKPRQSPISTLKTRGPNTFKVFGSNDNMSWNEIDSQRDITYNLDETRTFRLPFQKTPYKYYVIVVSKVGEEGGVADKKAVQIVEWGLFEDRETDLIYKKEIEISPVAGIERYPPVGMTGNTTTITGQAYGNGTYIASSSTVLSGGFQPFIGFDYDETSVGWHSAGSTYDSTTGVYIQNGEDNINGYFGDWLKIEMPEKIVLREYTIKPRQGIFVKLRGPNTFKVFGSNDNITWDEIDSQSGITYTPDETRVFGLPFNQSSYRYYVIVVNQVGGEEEGDKSSVQIVEWGLYGTKSGYQIPLMIHAGEGVDTSTDIYLNWKIRGDFGGIEFFGEDRITRLKYWFETDTIQSGIETKVWVKLGADDIPMRMTILYGDTRVDPKSNGDDTFDYFDDFEDPAITSVKFPTRFVSQSGGVPSGEIVVADGSVTINRLSSFQNGWSYIDSHNGYDSMRNHSVRFSASVGIDGIGEIAVRGNPDGDSIGFKARFDARSNLGYDILYPAYGVNNIPNWSGFPGVTPYRTVVPVGTNITYDFGLYNEIISFKVNDIERISAVNTLYPNPGSFGFQNHFGDSTSIHWTAVRRFVSPEPSVQLVGKEGIINLTTDLYVPIDSRYMINVFKISDIQEPVVDDELLKNIIQYSFSGNVGSDYNNDDGNTIPLSMFFKDVRDVFTEIVTDRIYSKVEQTIFNTSNSQSLHRLLRPRLNGRVREHFENPSMDSGVIEITYDGNSLIRDHFELLDSFRIVPDVTFLFTLKMKYNGIMNFNLGNGNILDVSWGIVDLDSGRNGGGINISGDEFDIKVALQSVEGDGLNPELYSSNISYSIDPGNPSSYINGTLVNIGSVPGVTTSLTSATPGSLPGTIRLNGGTGRIEISPIDGIRSVTMFCRFTPDWTSRNYLIDARVGFMEGYLTIFGPQIGSLWTNCKMYINGGIGSEMTNDSVFVAMDENERWIHITLVANADFSDDVTLFNRFTQDPEGTDVEVGIVKFMNREITEEENQRLFNQHSWIYSIPLQDRVRDGLVYYIDPMNPRSYVSGALTMTNLVNPNTTTTLRNVVYTLSRETKGLGMNDAAAGIDVGVISGMRTVSMWVKILDIETQPLFYYLLDARVGDMEGFFLSQQVDGFTGTLWDGCVYYLNGVSGTVNTSSARTILEDNGEWRHVVLIANRDFTDDITLLARFIGEEAPFCFFGPIKIFNRVLEESEILSLYDEFSNRYVN